MLAKLAADAPQRLERLGRLIERWEDAVAAGRLFGDIERIAKREERRLAFGPMMVLIAVVVLLAWIAYRM